MESPCIADLKVRVIETAKKAARAGLIRATSGNISARDQKTGLIVITPTGVPCETLHPGQLPVIDVDGKVVYSAKDHEPSSESPLHTAVYRARPDVNGLIHTHAVYATVLSALVQEIPVITVPLAIYGPVPVVPFSLPGSPKLGSDAVTFLGSSKMALLLQNHGALCLGQTVEEALTCAIYLEEGAQIAYLAKLAGDYSTIPNAEAEIIRTGAYGHKNKP